MFSFRLKGVANCLTTNILALDQIFFQKLIQTAHFPLKVLDNSAIQTANSLGLTPNVRQPY
jgi:hypothetical protein